MTQAFDPYHKWLGIAPKDQPPNHYRLLGIELFEDDPDVISAAAERQMMHLHSLKLGPRVELSQRLLNELAAARICLLKPREKAEYDARLRRMLAPPPPKVENNAPTPVLALPVAMRVMPVATSVPDAEPVTRPWPLIGLATAVSVIGVVFLVLGGWVAFRTADRLRGERSQVELAKSSDGSRPPPAAGRVRADATQTTRDITSAAERPDPLDAKSLQPMPPAPPLTAPDRLSVAPPESRSDAPSTPMPAAPDADPPEARNEAPPATMADASYASRAVVPNGAEQNTDFAALRGRWNVYFTLPTDTTFDIAADGSVAFSSFLSTVRRGRLHQDGDAMLLLCGDDAFARLRLEHDMLVVDQFAAARDLPRPLGVGVGALADGAGAEQKTALRTTSQTSGAAGAWNDFDLHGNSVSEEFVHLTSTALSTKQCYSGPLEIAVVARTDKDNIRLCAYGHAGLIFNWEVARNQLRGRRPNGSFIQYATNPLKPNTWYQFRWQIAETSFQAFVDDQPVFDEHRVYNLSAANPVWIPGGVNGSTVDVKSFTVTPLVNDPR